MTATLIAFLVSYILIGLGTAGYAGYALFKNGLNQGWSWNAPNGKLQALGTTLQALVLGVCWPGALLFEGIKYVISKFHK